MDKRKQNKQEEGAPDWFSSIRRRLLASSSSIVILKLEHILYVRRILDIKIPPERALLDRRKVAVEEGIDNPEPDPSKGEAEGRAREHLRRGVVAEINPRIHGEEGDRPGDERHDELLRARGEADALEGEEGEVGGEEEHVLGVGGGPSVRVAGLECSARVEGARLLDRGLDELVEELGDEEADGEAHALELAAEDEVGDETAQAYEDGDERDPGQEMAEPIAPSVPDVG